MARSAPDGKPGIGQRLELASTIERATVPAPTTGTKFREDLRAELFYARKQTPPAVLPLGHDMEIDQRRQLATSS